ncbi:TPA: glycosyl hydrolase family 17 protein [Legionella anisa]
MNQVQLACALFLMMSHTFAGNPVLHYLDKPFPAKSSTLGGSVTSTYIFTNNLPFTFKKPFQVIPILCPSPNQECTATGVEFKYNDLCTGKKLQPKESCTYSITLTPSSIGRKTILVAYSGYDNNVVHVQPALTTVATTAPAGILGTTNFPTAQPLPRQTFANTNYTVAFTFTNYDASTASFVQNITQNNNPLHPNFVITYNSCIPTGTTGTLASGAQCSIIGIFNSPTNGAFILTAELIGNLSSNKLVTSTTVQSVSFNQLIGVDYNPNHYTNNYPFNFHDVFYTGTLNNSAATNVYAELQQLQDAGFTTVRSYQTEPYSWIDIIKQANALGMKVIYEAVIPQLPSDTMYPGCPLGAQDFIPCAQATLTSVIQEVTPAVFNNTVILVFAGHENYCNAGNMIPPCTGTSNVTYLTSAVSALQTTLTSQGLATPVGSAVISGNFVTPSPAISADMQTLVNSYSSTAPLAFDPYPFQFGVAPAKAAVWTPPLSTTVQLTNSLAWDYIQVVGSTTPPALPTANQQPFYTPGRVLLTAETGWATAGTTTGYACNSPGPCAPSVANATDYFETLYQLNTSNFVKTSGYNIGVLAFEAYDEPAKPGPTAEQHYGLFNSNCVQKSAGIVPKHAMVSATGCQGFTNGTLLTISGTTPPTQASFKVHIAYPSGQHPTINATIPANSGVAPNISSVTPWPQFLIYQGAKITVSSTTSSQSCTTTATTVTASPSSITFGPVTCTNPPPSSMGCFGLGCQLSNPF